MREFVWWQTSIHPSVAERYKTDEEDPFTDWRWPRYASRCGPNVSADRPIGWLGRFRSLLERPFLRRGRFDYRAVGVYHAEEPTEPLAIAIYLPNTSNARETGQPALYLEWAMARLDEQHRHRKSARFGQYLMDWLINRSRQDGLDGRVQLHAVTRSLAPTYLRWGFEAIEQDARLIRFRQLHSGNDGLFHELLPPGALEFNRRFDQYR